MSASLRTVCKKGGQRSWLSGREIRSGGQREPNRSCTGQSYLRGSVIGLAVAGTECTNFPVCGTSNGIFGHWIPAHSVAHCTRRESGGGDRNLIYLGTVTRFPRPITRHSLTYHPHTIRCSVRLWPVCLIGSNSIVSPRDSACQAAPLQR